MSTVLLLDPQRSRILSKDGSRPQVALVPFHLDGRTSVCLSASVISSLAVPILYYIVYSVVVYALVILAFLFSTVSIWGLSLVQGGAIGWAVEDTSPAVVGCHRNDITGR